ncbi:hypothetical protein M3Y95_00004500 [Aphelenchoides besseyi]|nr:hypothetical protein M3Y95_00004500 [Aphelenchoides besseyi]
MGQTLSEPVTAKETTMCQSSAYNVASCAMQGWRISMEDSHIHLLEMPSDKNAAFFAVYDGHGGARVSQFAGLHLHKRIFGNEEYKNNDIAAAIKAGFLKLDDDLRDDEETKEQMCGTTAITVLIKDNKIYCGNCGDSRAVISKKGCAVPLSYDHKPNNESEMARIQAAGGWVDAGRVNGNLALSRALGDFVFKNNSTLDAEEQIVTALPDVIEMELTDDHEFIVLACDGIWDVLSNQQVVDYCRDRLAHGATPETVCEEVVDRCLAPDCELSGVGCDNMTIVLVCLTRDLDNDAFIKRLQREPEKRQLSDEHESETEDMSKQIAQTLQIDSQNWSAVPTSTSTETPATNTKPVDDTSSTSTNTTESFVTPSESPDTTNNVSATEECKLVIQHVEDDSPPTEFVVITNRQAAEQEPDPRRVL